MALVHQLALRFLVLDLLFVPIPQLEPRNSDFSSANFLCAISALPCRSCRRSRGSCTVNSGGNHQHFFQATLVARGDNHAPDAWVERHFRQLLANRGQSMVLGHRAEFEQS